MVVNQKGTLVTITIDIHLHPEQGDIGAQLDDHMKALGFVRQRPGYEMQRVLTGNAQVDHNTMVEEASKAGPGPIIKVPDEPITQAEAEAIVDAAKRNTFVVPEGMAAILDKDGRATGELRERGKPSPGHKRRTNAEIAEDEAADKADAERLATAASDTPTISTGGQRIDPDNPDDVAADEADEAADTAVSNGGKLTHDNLRDIMATYVKAYGLPAAQEDVPKVFSGLFGADVVKVSQVPEDRIAEAIEAVKKAGRENTYERTALAVA